jgi:arylamine N-acetyltransferase
LTELQAAHLVHVPFENLHVFYRVGVRVDVEWSFREIVEQRRGGWCFELNGCFAELLRRLGYAVDLLSCRTLEPETGGLSATCRPSHVHPPQPGDPAPRSAAHARRRPVDSRHAYHRRAMGRGAPHLVRAVRPAHEVTRTQPLAVTPFPVRAPAMSGVDTRGSV